MQKEKRSLAQIHGKCLQLNLDKKFKTKALMSNMSKLMILWKTKLMKGMSHE